MERELRPGEVVKVQVEIWPTSMAYEKGTRIRLDVQPHDGQHYFSAYHLKSNTIYTGGEHASYVLLPIIPPRTEDESMTAGKAHGAELDVTR
ncbi:MAG TPA: CocE/NonD family hydrolase C-terminal non-catalytic domain-containing protein [Steroidobacter sp.]